VTDIALIGGGHAHVEVLRCFAQRPMASVRLTLITPNIDTIYSGMLPGWIAGHYGLGECVVDLSRLCAEAGARLIRGAATGLDRANGRVLVEQEQGCDYDVVSFDVGIGGNADTLAGAREHAVAVKPIAEFAMRWPQLKARCLAHGGPTHILVVGGGPAGLELILAINHGLRSGGGPTFRAVSPRLTLVSGSPILEDACPKARALARQALAARGIELLAGRKVVSVEAGGARLEDGAMLEADLIFIAIGGRAPPWLARTGLALDRDGFLAIDPTLQSQSDPNAFAVGDCASMPDRPRPRAGVIAVRQGPVLADNLRRRVTGAALRHYRPQTRMLMLIGLGNAEAIACRGALAAKGAWAWRWKQRIDRGWLKRYQP
jgi:pyridine nucleotide-disulfide oxidoreductase family protein